MRLIDAHLLDRPGILQLLVTPQRGQLVDVASGEKIIGQPRTASALPDKPAGGAPPLQQQNAPGAITLTASEWDARKAMQWWRGLES